MSASPDKQGDETPTPTKRRFSPLVAILCSLVLLLLSSVFVGTAALEIVVSLLFGWASFLTRTLPEVRVNPELAGIGVVCFVGFTVGMHAFASWIWRHRKGGASWSWRWSFGITGAVFLAFTAGISAIAITHQGLWLVRGPGIVSSGGEVRRISCRANLKQIGLGLQMYASEFGDGVFPPNFQPLEADEALTTSGIFSCPSVGISYDGSTLGSDYVYVAGGLRADGPAGDRIVVAYDAYSNHPPFVNVLFADGHVESFAAESPVALYEQIMNPVAGDEDSAGEQEKQRR